MAAVMRRWARSPISQRLARSPISQRLAPLPISRRRALLAAAAATLAGCGFRPVYGDGPDGAPALRGAVIVEPAPGRLGFAFNNRLRRRFGPPGPDAAMTVSATLAFQETGLAISRDDDITRFDIAGRAAFVVTRRVDGAELDAGAVEAVSAYSTTASPFATRAAQRDAQRRVAEELAERVFLRIAALAAREEA